MERMKVRLFAFILTMMLLTILPFIFLSSIQIETYDSDCDSSYTDVCIPPHPPDLNCDDISNKNFEVLPSDPHDFD
jgi:hypothetical protein